MCFKHQRSLESPIWVKTRGHFRCFYLSRMNFLQSYWLKYSSAHCMRCSAARLGSFKFKIVGFLCNSRPHMILVYFGALTVLLRPSPSVNCWDPLTFTSPDSLFQEESIGEVLWFKELISCSSTFWKSLDSSFGRIILDYNYNYLTN